VKTFTSDEPIWRQRRLMISSFGTNAAKVERIMNKKGATSILVIFMMIVLVTLGAFAITSARVNLKFADKALEWDKMYYSLDDRAEEYLKDVDVQLAKAEKLTMEYINDKEDEEVNEIYFSYAEELLQILSDQYPEQEIIRWDQVSSDINFIYEENEEIGLYLSIDVNPIGINRENGKSRYTILAWNEWQLEEDVQEQTQNLWNPNFDSSQTDIFGN